MGRRNLEIPARPRVQVHLQAASRRASYVVAETACRPRTTTTTSQKHPLSVSRRRTVDITIPGYTTTRKCDKLMIQAQAEKDGPVWRPSKIWGARRRWIMNYVPFAPADHPLSRPLVKSQILNCVNQSREPSIPHGPSPPVARHRDQPKLAGPCPPARRGARSRRRAVFWSWLRPLGSAPPRPWSKWVEFVGKTLTGPRRGDGGLFGFFFSPGENNTNGLSQTNRVDSGSPWFSRHHPF